MTEQLTTAYSVIYATIPSMTDYAHRKAAVLVYLFIYFFFFFFLLICVFVLTLNFIKNIPNVYFTAILMKLVTCNVRNAFTRPPCPNAQTV